MDEEGVHRGGEFAWRAGRSGQSSKASLSFSNSTAFH